MPTHPTCRPSPVVKAPAPVLVIHGLDDPYLLPGALDGTWQWVDDTSTVVTLPHVGHLMLRDAATQVVPHVRNWLARRSDGGSRPHVLAPGAPEPM